MGWPVDDLPAPARDQRTRRDRRPELDSREPATCHGGNVATPRRVTRSMTGRRLWLVAIGLFLAAVLLAPVTCSQSSAEPRPRCDTLLSYWTPFGEWMQGLVLVAVVLGVVAYRRRTRR